MLVVLLGVNLPQKVIFPITPHPDGLNFLLATFRSLIGAVCAGIMFVMKWYARDYFEMYAFFITFVDCMLFTVGSAYYVAGSYPIGNDTIDEALGASDEKDKKENT